MRPRSRMARTTAADSTPPPAACCTPVAAPGMGEAEAGTLATLFKALADPHRVRIVNILANSDRPVCVCDFQPLLGLSQPTVSFHLKKLLQAGLVTRAQRGTWAHYELDRGALRGVARAFEGGR